ncbi:hypothetical protein AMJ57_05330 [Parcubacteria bacterium SG8_24]|nr:MAG: hypothetical protein AMJ57_05330 [Parcubacteria bacterium SG8_24]
MDTGLEEAAEEAGLEVYEGTTIGSRIGEMIGPLLGLVGVLFMILVIYAGFLWMTAGGNEERVTKARKILVGATIGVIIVFSAYAITEFVLSQVVNVERTST